MINNKIVKFLYFVEYILNYVYSSMLYSSSIKVFELIGHAS